MKANHRDCRRIASVTAWALLVLAGCGGSGGNGPPSGGGVPPPGPDPTGGELTVSVTARDAFGAAVPDATITLYYSSGSGFLETQTRTDANGQASIQNAPDNVYAVSMQAEALFGVSYEPSQPADNLMEFDVTLHPLSGFTPGISRLIVSGRSADSRKLEFNARLYVIEGNASTDLEDWNLGDVGVLPCAHDTGAATVDCVSTTSGFEYSYVGSTLDQSWVEPDGASDPLAISLLLDQGASIAVTDPEDRRLLGAKYFQTQLDTDDQVLLAAFAADNASTGDAALLPSQPVTIFPVASPAFTTDGSAYYSTIDSLATLEGGGSPLYAAVDEMIGFTASAAPADSLPAVVVLASGGVSDCGSIADCGAAQDALLQQSVATGVGVVAVGLSDPSLQLDRKNLARFAQAERGAVFWALNATNVPTILGRIPEILDGRHGAVDVRIRLESPVAGAFASGNTVSGNLQVIVCPWDCDVLVTVPFALRVP